MRPISKNLLLGTALGFVNWILVELGVSSLRSSEGTGSFHYLYLLIPWVIGVAAFLLLRADYVTELILRAGVALLLTLFLMACFDITQLRHVENMISTGGWPTLFHLLSCLSGLVAGGVIAAYRMQP